MNFGYQVQTNFKEYRELTVDLLNLKVLKSKLLTYKTEMRIYKTLTKLVVMYGSETQTLLREKWKDLSKFRTIADYKPERNINRN